MASASKASGLFFMDQATTGICLLGCGVVGSGVAKILCEQADLLQRRIGLRFDLRHVVVRDAKKHKTDKLPFTTDANAAIDDPKVQIVLELLGGTTTAGTLIE